MNDMGQAIRGKPIFFGLVFAVLAAGAAFAKAPARTNANPSFKTRLSKPDVYRHMLSRLTFGPRAGDLETIRRMGVKRWLDRQLHPELIAENPLLLERLQPFESLRLSIRETYLRYPPPQLIGAIARGRGELPDDPELRELLTRLVARYIQRKLPSVAKDKAPQDATDLSDLEPRLHLGDILTATQIETLKQGKPEEKRQLLESLPADKRTDFVWALRPSERQRLYAFAPVSLRRELMRSVTPQNVIAMDLTEAKLLRAVYSNRQLQELAIDFWFNHFNVFLDKGADRYTVPTYEREAIRPYVFGKFHDLLVATAKSPAMLFYLDNWESVAPSQSTHQPERTPNGGEASTKTTVASCSSSIHWVSMAVTLNAT